MITYWEWITPEIFDGSTNVSRPRLKQPFSYKREDEHHFVVDGDGWYLSEFEINTKRITKKDVETAINLCLVRHGGMK